MIEENTSLRNSLARSPPATSVSPPAIEEGRGEEEGGGGGGEGIIPLYAQVDKSKVSFFLHSACVKIPL